MRRYYWFDRLEYSLWVERMQKLSFWPSNCWALLRFFMRFSIFSFSKEIPLAKINSLYFDKMYIPTDCCFSKGSLFIFTSKSFNIFGRILDFNITFALLSLCFDHINSMPFSPFIHEFSVSSSNFQTSEYFHARIHASIPPMMPSLSLYYR